MGGEIDGGRSGSSNLTMLFKGDFDKGVGCGETLCDPGTLDEAAAAEPNEGLRPFGGGVLTPLPVVSMI